MKAIGYSAAHSLDDEHSLMDIDLTEPKADGRDILVRVESIAVNPVDTKIRAKVNAEQGCYKVLGWDAVGEVVQTGSQVSLFKVGDRVWYAGDLRRQGCNAQYQLVDERIVGRAPDSLTNAEAAALPLTALTAWELLYQRLGIGYTSKPLNTGADTILIIGAGGGVGSIMTQLAARLSDATVIGTASRDNTRQWVKQCGADHVINHHHGLQNELHKIGVDHVTHAISLSHSHLYFGELAECLAPQGKYALIDDPETMLDISLLKKKSISLHWEFMFTRSMYGTGDMIEQHRILNKVASLVDEGVIKTTLKTMLGHINAGNLIEAHRMIESHRAVGKIVLDGFP